MDEKLIIDTPKEHEIAETVAEIAKKVAAIEVMVRDIQKVVKAAK